MGASESGLYIPIFLKDSGHHVVNSMIHLSDEKLESPTQTWGIVATLIRRLDQLNESQSHIVYNADLYDDPVILENSKVSTTAPIIPHMALHDNTNPIVPIVDVECHDYIMMTIWILNIMLLHHGYLMETIRQ